jgi:hypothetical protein
MAKPGGTVARGWGTAHQRLRAKWAPLVEAGLATCARCGGWIDPRPVLTGGGNLVTSWHLDHDDSRSGYLGPSHRRCNLLDGARKGYKAQQRSKARRKAMRQRW